MDHSRRQYDRKEVSGRLSISTSMNSTTDTYQSRSIRLTRVIGRMTHRLVLALPPRRFQGGPVAAVVSVHSTMTRCSRSGCRSISRPSSSRLTILGASPPVCCTLRTRAATSTVGGCTSSSGPVWLGATVGRGIAVRGGHDLLSKCFCQARQMKWGE